MQQSNFIWTHRDTNNIVYSLFVLYCIVLNLNGNENLLIVFGRPYNNAWWLTCFPYKMTHMFSIRLYSLFATWWLTCFPYNPRNTPIYETIHMEQQHWNNNWLRTRSGKVTLDWCMISSIMFVGGKMRSDRWSDTVWANCNYPLHERLYATWLWVKASKAPSYALSRLKLPSPMSDCLRYLNSTAASYFKAEILSLWSAHRNFCENFNRKIRETSFHASNKILQNAAVIVEMITYDPLSWCIVATISIIVTSVAPPRVATSLSTTRLVILLSSLMRWMIDEWWHPE
jgi:hypothetical protein